MLGAARACGSWVLVRHQHVLVTNRVCSPCYRWFSSHDGSSNSTTSTAHNNNSLSNRSNNRSASPLDAMNVLGRDANKTDIGAIGPETIKINGQLLHNNVILFPTGYVRWNVSHASEITAASLALIAVHHPRIGKRQDNKHDNMSFTGI
jgi:hypothetical protein